MPALYVWMVSHYVMHNGRPTCPLEDFCMVPDKSKINWEELLASMTGSIIRWFPRWEEVPNVLCRCGVFPNVILMGTKGCVNYNLMLGIRQLGYPIRGPPSMTFPWVALKKSHRPLELASPFITTYATVDDLPEALCYLRGKL